ncbi:MAG: hypothetical protein K5622_00385, partial [Endomicrobiaceae bacterium]|nr:hypothetical protein [Endomicrobiaceae bacterium]
MNKIESCLYNTVFWISRFITISVLGTCCFAVLNAKYMWSETFFPLINNIFFSLFKNVINTFSLFADGCSSLKFFVLYFGNVEQI